MTIFGYFSTFITELILNRGKPIIIENDMLPKGYVAYIFAYYIVECLIVVTQIILIWDIHKKTKNESNALKAVLICFIIYAFSYLIYIIYSNLLYEGWFALNNIVTYLNNPHEQIYQSIYFAIGNILRIARIVAIIPIFPLIVQYQGEIHCGLGF